MIWRLGYRLNGHRQISHLLAIIMFNTNFLLLFQFVFNILVLFITFNSSVFFVSTPVIISCLRAYCALLIN